MSDDPNQPSRLTRIKSWFQRNYSKLENWSQKFSPEPDTRKWAIRGIVGIVLLIMGYLGGIILMTGLGKVADIGIGVLIGIMFLIIGYLIGRIVFWLFKVLSPGLTSWILAGFGTLLFFGRLDPPMVLLFIGAFVLGAASFIGSIHVMRRSDFRNAPIWKKVFVPIISVGGLAAIVGALFFMTRTGTKEGLLKVDDSLAPKIVHLDIADPSLPGEYEIDSLTYGSGEDRRPEFGEKAMFVTERINGRAFLNKPKGFMSGMRNKYWGFNRTQLPLNGRVWYPKGEGPFPLVLIVHGNHSMRDYSDPGYAYLGRLLASKGYILVSVDENFVNGDYSKNYSKENDARGWIMLEHLRQWRDWTNDSEHPFYGKVDLENLGLMGHSRGGEAVSIAAAFNTLPYYPDDARVKFDYNFNLKAIVSIAQVDGQYKPSDISTPVKDVNFLFLHGSHDSDVSRFQGDKQYKRISFSGDQYNLKTSIYAYRANHGQFNTTWGNRDWGLPHGHFLNTKALLPEPDQRKIAEVYIPAFLDLTMRDNYQLLPFFQDYRYGKKWLPETYYINRFEDSETHIICDFDEDIDVLTGSLDAVTLQGKNLATWHEEDLGFRSSSVLRQNQAVYLGWDYEAIKPDSLEKADFDSMEIENPAEYSIAISDLYGTGSKVDSSSSFTFAFAQVDEKPRKPDSLDPEDDNDDENEDDENEENENEENDNKGSKEKKDSKNKDDKDEPVKPVDFTIILSDSAGHQVEFLFSEVAFPMPPFKAKLTRLEQLEDNFGKSSEAILQTIQVNQDWLKKKSDQFDLKSITEIRFRFDKTRKAVIVMDEIGFRSAFSKTIVPQEEK